LVNTYTGIDSYTSHLSEKSYLSMTFKPDFLTETTLYWSVSNTRQFLQYWRLHGYM